MPQTNLLECFGGAIVTLAAANLVVHEAVDKDEVSVVENTVLQDSRVL